MGFQEMDRGRLWARLGFADDPYYVAPLPVATESLELFVGRDEDRSRLRTFLTDAETGKTMVQGSPGVGKTSLVNVVQWELFRAGERFPLFDRVEVPSDATRESFLLEAVSGVVSSFAQPFEERDLQRDKAYLRAREAVTQTLRRASDLSLAIGPVGVGGGRAPVPVMPLAPTAPALTDLLRGLVSSVRRRGFRGLVIPVNNLDRLSADEAMAFLNTVRDATGAVEGIHWLFIGGEQLFEELERRLRRVSESFTNNPVSLPPLAWDDVARALERRRAHFALETRARLPISAAVARLVYDAGGGELRFTMARMSRTVREYCARFPSEREVPDAMAMALLADWAHTQLDRHRLTRLERRVLEAVRARGALRAKDYREVHLNSSQRLSQVLRSLEAKEFLRREYAGPDRTRGYVLSAAARFLPAAR